MIAVLRKDLRLSLDVLLPWVMVVVAVVGVGALSGRFRGIFSAFPSRTVLLEEFATILVLSVGAMTAWITAVVVHGDRRHRAGMLAATLPMSSSRRDGTRFASIVVASALPVGVCVAAQMLRGTSTTVGPLIEPGRTWWLPIAMGIAGIGWAWLAARWTRKTFEVVGLSVVGGALAIGAGLGGAWIYDVMVVAPLATVPGTVEFRGRLMSEAMVSLPPIALLSSGLVAVVVARLIGRSRRRAATVCLAAVVTLAMIAVPAIAGAAAARGAVLGNSQSAQMFREYEKLERVRSLPEGIVVEYLRAWNGGADEPLSIGNDRPGVSTWELWQVFCASGGRPAAVTEALAALTRVDTAANAAFTMQSRAACRRLAAGDDPAIELDAVRRYPRDYAARFYALRALVTHRFLDGDAHAATLAEWANTPRSPEREEVGALVRFLEYVRDRQPPSSRIAKGADDAAQALRQAWQFVGDDELPDLPPMDEARAGRSDVTNGGTPR